MSAKKGTWLEGNRDLIPFDGEFEFRARASLANLALKVEWVPGIDGEKEGGKGST